MNLFILVLRTKLSKAFLAGMKTKVLDDLALFHLSEIVLALFYHSDLSARF